MTEPPQPPPQYPVYPEYPSYPPQYYGYPPPSGPVEPRIPGLAMTSVVFLWVMAGFGALGAVVFGVFVALRPALVASIFPDLGSWMPLVMIAYAVQTLAWAVLRAFIAVGIKRRSARARNGAIVVESVGIAFQVAFSVILAAAVINASPDNYRLNFDCTGIVLPILVLIFLSTAKSRMWCDR